MKAFCIGATIVCMAVTPAAASKTKKYSTAGDAPQIVTAEPAKGHLPLGEVVYVDDHSCPSGQIKKVTGGSGTVPRERECVAHP